MGKYAQLVIGPAGCGKVRTTAVCCCVAFSCAALPRRAALPRPGRRTLIWCRCSSAGQAADAPNPSTGAPTQSTYCEQLWSHCQAIGRPIHCVNLGEQRQQ